MKKYCLFILITVIYSSCFSPQKDYVVKPKLIRLSPDEIFDKDIVSDAIFDAEEMATDTLKNKSMRLFLKGVDAYKNKKNPSLAISLFKNSILEFPSPKAYFELGNALLDSDEGAILNKIYIDQASKSFEIAENLKFQPVSMIKYGLARVYGALYIIDHNEYTMGNAIYFLGEAFSAGYSDSVRLYSDPFTKTLVHTNKYQNMLSQIAIKRLSGGSNNLFEIYKNIFPKQTGAFEIEKEKVSMKEYTNSIDYGFAKFIPEMENSRFGRNVSQDYYYVAKLEETPAYTAVIYTSMDFAMAEMNQVHTKIVTYDPAGNIIAARLFSCQCDAEKIRTGRYSEHEIILEDFKRIWKKPIDSVPFSDNEVDKYEPMSVAKFAVDESGNIIEKSVPANYSDSSVIVTYSVKK